MSILNRANSKNIVLFLLAIVVCAGAAFGSKFSTKWIIRNSSKQSLSAQCKLTSSQGLNISMTTASIAPNIESVYDWGDDYYNDGLWLNAGKWECQVLNNREIVNNLKFETTWGENVVLEISRNGEQFKIAKVVK
jgi:hypothetical protein